jgi:hypothetical protein
MKLDIQPGYYPCTWSIADEAVAGDIHLDASTSPRGTVRRAQPRTLGAATVRRRTECEGPFVVVLWIK